MRDRVEFYRDQNGEWRWRYVAINNAIMACSSEGYVRQDDAFEAAEHVLGVFTDHVPATVNSSGEPDWMSASASVMVRSDGSLIWVVVRHD